MNNPNENPPDDFGPKLTLAITQLVTVRDAAAWPVALAHLAHMAKTAPLILSALASRDVVDMVLAITTDDGPACYGILNARIGWLKDRLLQLQYVGRLFDYAAMPPGSVTVFGAQLEICPGCGKPGVKHTHMAGVGQYTHVEQINSWLTSTPVVSCLWVDESQMAADDAPPTADGL